MLQYLQEHTPTYIIDCLFILKKKSSKDANIQNFKFSVIPREARKARVIANSSLPKFLSFAKNYRWRILGL